jgi:transcriptional regulator with XRE-family HTH domain
VTPAALRPPPPPAPATHVGRLLREWRAARRLSQLGLALEAGISARHLSYVETGKAQPSRDLVARLADALQLPLRERNALLIAAGYAPRYAETGLAAASLAPVRRAIDLILAQQEPYAAFVLNRHWDVVLTNAATPRLLGWLCGGTAHRNVLHQVCDPSDVRRVLVNWDEVAGDLIGHLHDDIARVPSDARARALLDEVLRYPGVPSRWRSRDPVATPPPLLTVVFRKGDRELRFFSTISTFGTPHDVTLDELRIECWFPADEATGALCRDLASARAVERHG